MRLIQKSTTLVDLRLDPSIRLRFRILKECYLVWTDDFPVASLPPEIAYSPNVKDWRSLRITARERYWRQGFVIGHLDRLLDSMIVDFKDYGRPLNFGEFEAIFRDESSSEHQSIFAAVEDIFIHFDFRARPVLGRILLMHACFMRALMSAYANTHVEFDVIGAMQMFLDHSDCAKLIWWEISDADQIVTVTPLLMRRIEQAAKLGDCLKFR